MLMIVLVSLAAFVGSAINAVAGGGTFIVFPALTGIGQLSEKLANITSTLGIWSGQAASVAAARSEFRRLPRTLLYGYAAISLGGGVLGSLLLIHTSPVQFKLVIPWLLAFATIVFAASQPIARWTGRHQASNHSMLWTILIGFVQFAVAIYGGYFGAGMGVLMLAGLSFTGMEDIHQMNAMKVLLGTIINGVACVIFAFDHPVWRFVVPMAICSSVAGFVGMTIARKIPRQQLRMFILCCGVLLTIVYFVKNYGPMIHRAV
jgi:hypothetical protein